MFKQILESIKMQDDIRSNAGETLGRIDDEQVRDMYLDQHEDVIAGAEKDKSIDKLISSVPEYEQDEDNDALSEEDIEELTESLQLL